MLSADGFFPLSNLLSQPQRGNLFRECDLYGTGLCMNLSIHFRNSLPIIFFLLLFTALAAGQQWQPLGPDGGDVRSFACDPSDPDRMFLGTSSGRLYISIDGGNSWSRYPQLGDSS